MADKTPTDYIIESEIYLPHMQTPFLMKMGKAKLDALEDQDKSRQLLYDVWNEKIPPRQKKSIRVMLKKGRFDKHIETDRKETGISRLDTRLDEIKKTTEKRAREIEKIGATFERNVLNLEVKQARVGLTLPEVEELTQSRTGLRRANTELEKTISTRDIEAKELASRRERFK